MSRSRPRSSAAALALILTITGAFAAPAQDGADRTGPVLIVDQERLFAESAYGQAVLDEIERRSEALAAENRAIEAELVAEEQRLTDLRGELSSEAFRPMADAFDDRVQSIRREQDAKVRAVQSLRERSRQEFSARAGPILSELVRDRGAQVLLDSRSVLRAVEGVDVTDAAIGRVDAELGEGDVPAPGDP